MKTKLEEVLEFASRHARPHEQELIREARRELRQFGHVSDKVGGVSDNVAPVAPLRRVYLWEDLVFASGVGFFVGLTVMAMMY